MQNLRTVLGIVLLERSQKRIISNYNENGSLNNSRSQREFEAAITKVLNNTFDGESEHINILVFQNKLIVSKVYREFYLLIVSEHTENEIILSKMLEIIEHAIDSFCGNNLSLKNVYENYEEIVLVLNEVFSNGLVLTLNENDLIDRVLLSNLKKGKQTGDAGKRRGIWGFLV